MVIEVEEKIAEYPSCQGVDAFGSAKVCAEPKSSYQPKLLTRMRQAMRSRYYSRRFEQTYCRRVKRFIFFHGVRHLAEMGEPELNAFLTDLADGWGRGSPSDAQDRKYPSAPREWIWQWVFPQENRWKNPKTGEEGRHPTDEPILQKALKRAVGKAGVLKRATCHTLRHSFATHLIEQGCDISTVQEFPGHKDIRMTMLYTNVLNHRGRGVKSPVDDL